METNSLFLYHHSLIVLLHFVEPSRLSRKPAIGICVLCAAKWEFVDNSLRFRLASVFEMAEFDGETLLHEVSLRRVLWDINDNYYGNREFTTNAWAEVCRRLVPDFDSSSEEQKSVHGESCLYCFTPLHVYTVKSLQSCVCVLNQLFLYLVSQSSLSLSSRFVPFLS